MPSFDATEICIGNIGEVVMKVDDAFKRRGHELGSISVPVPTQKSASREDVQRILEAAGQVVEGQHLPLTVELNIQPETFPGAAFSFTIETYKLIFRQVKPTQ